MNDIIKEMKSRGGEVTRAINDRNLWVRSNVKIAAISPITRSLRPFQNSVKTEGMVSFCDDAELVITTTTNECLARIAQSKTSATTDRGRQNARKICGLAKKRTTNETVSRCG